MERGNIYGEDTGAIAKDTEEIYARTRIKVYSQTSTTTMVQIDHLLRRSRSYTTYIVA